MTTPNDKLRSEPAGPGPPPTALPLVNPARPHDTLSFAELAQRYNFRRTSPLPRVFARLVIEECRRCQGRVRCLDVGCGRGIARQPEHQWAIRPHVDELWGLEPDESVPPPQGLYDSHKHALMEGADLPENHFDMAWSYMVMEHVADPAAFMEALWRCLKPGGVYIFATPNRRHYFTRTASTLHALRLDEAVLKLVKRRTLDNYHYPVQYRFNDERAIGDCAAQLGAPTPEYVYIEVDGPAGYLPGPLRPIFHVMALKRKLWHSPRALLTLICRMTKPAEPAKGGRP